MDLVAAFLSSLSIPALRIRADHESLKVPKRQVARCGVKKTKEGFLTIDVFDRGRVCVCVRLLLKMIVDQTSLCAPGAVHERTKVYVSSMSCTEKRVRSCRGFGVTGGSACIGGARTRGAATVLISKCNDLRKTT